MVKRNGNFWEARKMRSNMIGRRKGSIGALGLAVICFVAVVNAAAQADITVESDKPIALIYSSDYLFTDELKLESEKKVRIDIEDAQVVYLKVGGKEYPLFLEQHDNLLVTFESNEIQFERSGSANNRFFQIYMDRVSGYKAYEEKSIDAVEIKAFDFREKQQKLIKEYPKYDFMTKRFQRYLETENEYRYRTSILMNGILNKRAHRIPEELIPDFMNSGFSDSEKMVSKWYRDFLFYYSAYQAMRDNGFEDIATVTGMYIIHSYWVNQHVKEFSVFNLDYELLKRYAPEMDPVILYNTMQKYEKERGRSIDDVRKFVAVYARKEAEGTEEKPVESEGISKADLVAIDMKGKEVRLSDLSKNIVYVDIWASWCGPCREQFKHSAKLHEGLSKKAKKSIVFLYISIDESPDKWKKTVEKLGLQGVHWNSTGGWSSNVVKYFGISSIPRYVIIGKGGKIINDNAPRPSDPKTIDTLNRLVN